MGHGQMTLQLKTARLIMIFINVIFFLFGATLIGQGLDLLITHRFENFIEFFPTIHNSIIKSRKFLINEIICIWIILPGFVVIFLGFFGCSGALTQIQCLLFSYSFILAMILIFQTILLVLFLLFHSRIRYVIVSRLYQFIHEDYQGPLEKSSSSLSILWDAIMYHFQCCGIENSTDFRFSKTWNRTNPWWINQDFQYPLTCCPINQTFSVNSLIFNQTISCAIHGNNLYEINCLKRLTDFYSSYQTVIVILLILILLIELFGLIFVLLIHLRNPRHRIYQSIEQSSRIRTDFFH